jgi:fructose-1-phosphate kinase PfkB-like protein
MFCLIAKKYKRDVVDTKGRINLMVKDGKQEANYDTKGSGMPVDSQYCSF